MAGTRTGVLLRLEYERAAEEYQRSLTLENYMEATPQATQRKITVASFEVIHTRRPNVWLFNELLVQYERPGAKIGQVVPDNMVVVSDQPVLAGGSFDLPFQPIGPLVVMEYVSKHNKRKDYDTNYTKYERQLQVPYYLLFYPDSQDLTLFQKRQTRYASVPENANGRQSIPELELEVALLDGWVRYWFRGELVPLPGDLVLELDALRQQLATMTRRADEAIQRADEATRRADDERRARIALEEELARLRAEMPPPRKRSK